MNGDLLALLSPTGAGIMTMLKGSEMAVIWRCQGKGSLAHKKLLKQLKGIVWLSRSLMYGLLN